MVGPRIAWPKLICAFIVVLIVRKWTQYEAAQHYEETIAVLQAMLTTTTFRSPLAVEDPEIIGERIREPKNLVPFPLYDVLPHLVNLPADALLNPTYPLKERVKRSANYTEPQIVVAIPSVFRPEVNYLRTTLDSLFESLSPAEASISKFIVMLAEIDTESDRKIDRVSTDLKKYFAAQLESGLLEFIVPPLDWYPPDLANTTPTLGDTQERMFWRTKQNLDYAYLMIYASHFYSKTKYYVQLEDDISAANGYITSMITFADDRKSDWLSCEFTTLGLIGKLFPVHKLPLIYRFILMFYADKPVDWLLDQLFEAKYCFREKDCFKERIVNKRRFYASVPLFQHLGRFSSLNGKKQTLRDGRFAEFRIFPTSENTTISGNPALLYTDSTTKRGEGSLTGPYTSSGKFLLQNPHAGDYFLYKFIFPVRLINLNLSLCNPAVQAPSAIGEILGKLIKTKRAPGKIVELTWNSTSPSEFTYNIDPANALNIIEVRFEVNDDSTPFCMESIRINS